MFYERNELRTDRLSLKVLIVDPDMLSRHNLIALLAHDKSIESVEECSHGIEAIAVIRDLRPDILISEVELPGMHGFALLDSLPQGNQPAIIFVSGRDQYAARAFDVSAVDYLLKPVVEERSSGRLTGRRKVCSATALNKLKIYLSNGNLQLKQADVFSL